MAATASLGMHVSCVTCGALCRRGVFGECCEGEAAAACRCRSHATSREAVGFQVMLHVATMMIVMQLRAHGLPAVIVLR
jgi:hypothetical protein